MSGWKRSNASLLNLAHFAAGRDLGLLGLGSPEIRRQTDAEDVGSAQHEERVQPEGSETQKCVTFGLVQRELKAPVYADDPHHDCRRDTPAKLGRTFQFHVLHLSVGGVKTTHTIPLL